MYLVKWKGYQLYETTWVEVEDLAGSKEMINLFENKGKYFLLVVFIL